MISIGRVYRRDTIDATHFPIFHQFEGLAIDKGITLADLKGTLLYVMRQLYGPEREVRFRTHYFPFTEPSMEPDVSCFNCGGAGCPICKHSGWIEMGGSGMVDPYLYEFVGWGPEEYTGFAFGVGIERTAQLRYGISGIRAVLGQRPPLPQAVPMRIPLELATRVRAGRRSCAGDRRRALDLDRRGPRPCIGSACPAISGSSASATCSRRRSIPTPTGCSSRRSTWGRTGRTRSSAGPGTSAPGRRWRWRCRARRSPGG